MLSGQCGVDIGLEALRASAHLRRERSVSRQSKARILLADDNADMRDYVARLLGEHFVVETAPDGQAALDKARSMLAHGGPPDLVLSDVMMPRLDGFGLLRELRADPALAAVPIILLSARAGEEARIEGVDAGADDYLIKPFSSRELVARVQAQVKMAAFRREADRALRESAIQLSEAQHLAHVGSWQWDAATNRNIVSDELREIFGVPAESPFPNLKDQDGLLYPHESFVRLDAAVQEAVRTGEGFSLDISALRNGEPIWVTMRSQAMLDAGGNVIGLRGTVQDITDRKRREADQALLVQIADDLSRLVDADEIMQAVGSRLGAHLDLDLCVFADVDDGDDAVTVNQGWSKEGVPNLRKQTFRITDYLTDEFRRANRAGEKVIVRDTATDGRTDAQAYARLGVGAFVTVPFLRGGRWTAYFAAIDGKPRDWRANEIELIEEVCDRVFPRIERARAEAELRASEARLRLATQTAQVGAFDFDVQTGANRWTPELEAMYGLAPGEFGCTQLAWEELLHPDDRAGAIAKVEETFTTGQPVEHEWRVVWRDGTVHWIAGRFQGFKDAGGRRWRLTGVNIDVSARKRAEAARDRLAAIVASSSDAIVSKTLDGTVTSWNEAAERIFGYMAEEMIGSSIRRIVPPDRQVEEDDILARIRRGERLQNYETVRLRKDGRQVDVSVTISPVFDEVGRIIGASKIAHDISGRKRAEERERLLMREVNHRAKNLLALVQAIARQTAAVSPDVFIERFTQRVQALPASQDVLVNSGWRSVPIEALVRAQLGHFADLIGQRIRLSGPEVKITAAAAQAIGLALHELATNAAKYGALSNDTGTVSVTWSVDGGSEPRFELTWVEKGGPTVTAPRRRGFGSTVTGSLTKMSLDGDVRTEYAAAGLAWRLSCPANKVIESESGFYRRVSTSVAVGKASGRKRILVVEDEALIAIEVAAMLEGAGFEVLGPVGSVDQALALIERSGCEAAVLDINLGSETAEPIASQLSRTGIPFVTISGYSRGQLPEGFGSAPHLSKPLAAAGVVDCLKRCMTGTPGRA